MFLFDKIKSFLSKEKQFFHQTSDVVKTLIIFRLLLSSILVFIMGLSFILFGVLGADAHWTEELQYFVSLLCGGGYVLLMLVPQRHIVHSMGLFLLFIFLNVLIIAISFIVQAILDYYNAIPANLAYDVAQTRQATNLVDLLYYLFFGMLPSLFLLTSKLVLKGKAKMG